MRLHKRNVIPRPHSALGHRPARPIRVPRGEELPESVAEAQAPQPPPTAAEPLERRRVIGALSGGRATRAGGGFGERRPGTVGKARQLLHRLRRGGESPRRRR